MSGNAENLASQNGYNYANNNPVNMSDPSGLAPVGLNVISAPTAMRYPGSDKFARDISGFTDITDSYKSCNWGSLAFNVALVASPGKAFKAAAKVTKIEKLAFKTSSTLMSHFEKHGAEMGYTNANDYLSGAQKLINDGAGVQRHIRTNGDQIFYDAAKNNFGVLSKDGNIRTFFQPTDGINYWQQQIR